MGKEVKRQVQEGGLNLLIRRVPKVQGRRVGNQGNQENQIRVEVQVKTKSRPLRRVKAERLLQNQNQKIKVEASLNRKQNYQNDRLRISLVLQLLEIIKVTHQAKTIEEAEIEAEIPLRTLKH